MRGLDQSAGDVRPAEPPVSLSLNGVSKHFGPVRAVDGIELAVRQDEFLSLLGPSGSGKTTLLRIIAGLELPDRGAVMVGGTDVTRLPPYRRRIGMVFQNFLLFPHKTVAENIIFPLRMQGLGKTECGERLSWALGLLKLKGLEDRYPNQLSGGQQQRVSLARGLISRPTLLLLDEPLANLDRELRAEMEVEIRRYQKELAIPFIYVTHNQEEALTMSDRIAVMHNGVFEQVAPRVEVYQRPATSFVASFVGQSNHLVATVLGDEGEKLVINWQGHTLSVPRKGSFAKGDIVRYSIKYEDVKVTGQRKTPIERKGQNFIAGKLRDIIFKGQTANFILALDHGCELVASGSLRETDAQIGQDVIAEWPHEAGACFRDGA
ncbi:ABC transporter ATP-binding protein [Aestuariivirga sp.]|uniref:ABC transporter ATP-binding protein n=1 Tax=Aestuariivirga sp. TaxID=2650926 RepID=UPI0039E3E376